MATSIPESRTNKMVAVPKLGGQQVRSISNRNRILSKAMRSPQIIIGLVCLGFFVALAVFAPLIAPRPYDALDLNGVLLPPSAAAPLGTDELGRDTLARIAYGGRVSLEVAFISVTVSMLFGIPVGMVAGYFGGAVDSVTMRVMDAFQAFPAVLLAIVIASVLGPGLTNAMIAIGVISIPSMARLMRGQVLQLKSQDYVVAARAVGASNARIIARHILPNALAALIIATALASAAAILTEASLSFVGLGATPPQPSWGGMLRLGYAYASDAPWLSITPMSH